MTSRTKIALKLTVTIGLIMMVFGWPALAHYRAKWKLEGYETSLRAKGEKTTIGELIPKISADDATAAMSLMANAGRLPSIGSNLPPLMKYISPGRAQVGWQQESLANQEVTNVWVELKDPMAANADALADMRAIVQDSAPAFSLNYEQGFNLMLPHLARTKTIAQWLSSSAIYDLHKGATSNALDNLNALTALGAKTDREPLLISELVRIAINAIGMATAWEAIQSPELREAELSDLQRAWQSVDFLTQAEAALAMEQAMSAKTFAAGRKSYAVIANGGFSSTPAPGTALAELTQLSKDVLENPKEGLMSMAHRYPGYWRWKGWQSYDDEMASIETIQASLEAVRRAEKGQPLGPAAKELEKESAQIQERHPAAGRWLGYKMMNGISSFIGRIGRIEMERTLLVTAIALKRYQLSHGAFPQHLNELVPQFLASVPMDPMDGQPLRYRPDTNGLFQLYSVGDDGEDNGGDVTPSKNASKQWLRAKDAVWPKPAGQAEILAERVAAEKLKKDSVTNVEFRKRYGLDSGSPPATGTTNSPKK